jgi:hypothetical protein
MRSTLVAALAAAAILSAASVVLALTRADGAPLAPDALPPAYEAVPARPHLALGTVRILAVPEEDAEPVTLAEAAEALYGRVDALANVRAEPLPYADGALLTALAVRWTDPR